MLTLDTERKKTTMLNNEMNGFNYRIPPNRLGYFAQHSRDNVPLEPDVLQAMVDGPLTAMQSKLTAELARQDRRRKETA